MTRTTAALIFSIVATTTACSAGNVVTVAQRSALSAATVAESRLYVIKSDVLHFFLNQTLDTPFEIFRVDINAFDQE